MKLIGTIPEARLSTIEWSPPGKLTVIMERLFYQDPNTAPPECPIANVVYVGHETDRPDDGGFGVIRWTFEGVQEIAGTESEYDNSGNSVVEMEVSLDQVPLGMHPKIASIMKTYGGMIKDGELTFPLKNSGSGLNSSRAADDQGEIQNANPLFGVKSYLQPRLIFRRRKMNVSVDPNTLGRIGKLPDGWDDDISSGQDSWLKSQISEKKHGSSKEVTEEWIFAQDGWQPLIYDYK